MSNSTRAMSSRMPYTGSLKGLGTYGDICHIEHCNMETEADVHIPLCMNHIRKAHAAYLILTDDGPDRELQERDTHSAEAKGYVYFMRMGEIVKIGWSSDPKSRSQSLQPDAIMHIQPGTRQDERALHGLFHHLLDHGKEWFKAEPELLDYVNGLHQGVA